MNGNLRIHGSRKRSEVEIDLNHIDRIQKESGWFRRWRLRIHSRDRDTFTIGGLDAISANGVVEAVRFVAAQRASELAPQLSELDQRIQNIFRGRDYVRHSSADALHMQIKSLAQDGNRELVRIHLPIPAIHALVRLHEFRRRDRLETVRERGNSKFVMGQAGAVRTAASGVLDHTLTDEQADAIATDEDVTLVLAGAGTGKTATITGKIAYLVRHQQIDPNEILVLAFNRKAAAEIRDRLPGDLRGARVTTFHAFGMRVVGEATGTKPSVSRLAEDGVLLSQVIDEILLDILRSSKKGESLRKLLALYRNHYRSPFEFRSKGEYIGYLRGCELRPLTLPGKKPVRVKSFEELQVANFLSLNGIDFEYEKPYPVNTANTRHRQYRPDFYLPDYDIYIEHFALDKDGNAPPHFQNYAEGVDWKRRIHKSYGTTLIETYTWQCRRGVLTEKLEKTLVDHGVVLGSVSIDLLFDGLRRVLESWLSRLLRTFLKHVKTSILTEDDLVRRAMDGIDKSRNLAFLRVFRNVRSAYEKILNERGAVDFEDLINDAAEHIRNHLWEVPYRYVLVDEFQDISAGRMAMLAALKRPQTAYFLVGDDWQSIYVTFCRQ